MFKYIDISPESVVILFVKCHCVFVITWDFESIFIFGVEEIGLEFGLTDKALNLFLLLFVAFEAFLTWLHSCEILLIIFVVLDSLLLVLVQVLLVFLFVGGK